MTCDIEKLQLQILEKIYNCKPYGPVQELTGIIKEIVNFSKEDVRTSIGNFGQKLINFASSIDRETPHPDIFKLFDGELTSNEEGTFSRNAVDVMKLVKHGKENKISKGILETLKKVLTKDKSLKAISHTIDNPEENLLHVRFIPCPNARNKVRSRKLMQVVNPDVLYKKGCDFWDAGPSDFTDFVRWENLYQSDIEEAESRHEHFNNLGLKQMSDEIKKSIDKLRKDSDNSQYFGFNKIPIYCASIILAKQSGFKYVNKKEISVDTQGFKYRFFAEADHLFDDSHVKSLMLIPRVYTYGELSHVASPQAKSVVEHLETFPEAGGHPLFDHYRVLVTGTNFLDYQAKGSYTFRMPDGSLSSDTKLSIAQLKLDSELIRQKEIPAVLLGERDGDCYFISYF